MDDLKFAIFAIIILGLLGVVGYWTVTTLQSGTEHLASEQVRELKKENENLKEQISELQVGAKSAAPEEAKEEPKPEVQTPPVKPAEKPAQAPVNKYQDLIDELQKLINGKISLTLKSIGPRVGTVQKFLNIYNSTSNRIDNDYGATTQKAVMAFQKDQGLKADGKSEAGTFTKMIAWLKQKG